MNLSPSLRALRSLQSTICTSCRSQFRPQTLRPFSQATSVSAKAFIDPGEALSKGFDSIIPQRGELDALNYKNIAPQEFQEEERHHLHVYATKHNTHITLTKPNRDALISVSAGNIGFRKAGRGSYDAAYQLAAFVMSRIQDKGLLAEIKKLEVIYRGFGPGREAVTKAILGSEGQRIRPLIVRLTDSTRLKFGGVRSPAPRRLG